MLIPPVTHDYEPDGLNHSNWANHSFTHHFDAKSVASAKKSVRQLLVVVFLVPFIEVSRLNLNLEIQRSECIDFFMTPLFKKKKLGKGLALNHLGTTITKKKSYTRRQKIGDSSVEIRVDILRFLNDLYSLK